MTHDPDARGVGPCSTAATPPDDRRGEAELFRIAVVCTGNRFRSPFAAALLRLLAEDLPVSVTSTGTLDVGAAPALEDAIAAARSLGLDLSSHVAQAAEPHSLSDDHLVIGFERTHVATCVVDLGVARERVFTLPELAMLLARLPPANTRGPIEHARAMVARADEARRKAPPLTAPEIPDPVGKSRRQARGIAQEIQALTVQTFTGLFGPAAVRVAPRYRAVS